MVTKIEYGLNAKLRLVPVILSPGDKFICHFHGDILDTIYFYTGTFIFFCGIYYFLSFKSPKNNSNGRKQTLVFTFQH